MGKVHFNTGQAVNWCLSIIKHEAITQKLRFSRWERDILLLNSVTETGNEHVESVPSPDAEDAFCKCEFMLWLNSLPEIQATVLYELYVLDKTEQEVANGLSISRQKVNRLKHRALSTLRKELY